MADVFYSVRPAGAGSGNDLKVACNIVIASGVATFSVAQTGDIGVGCYVLSSNTDGYISEMTDSTHAKIITALGATHANVSSEALTSIYHPYASLSAAEAGSDDANHLTDDDLVTLTIHLFWPCYGATADTTSVLIDTYTTSSSYKITVYTPQGLTKKESINNWRNTTTKWNTNYFRVDPTGTANTLKINIGNYEIIGLQIDHTDARYYACIEIAKYYAAGTIHSCVVRGPGGSNPYRYGIWSSQSMSTFEITNTVICDMGSSTYCHGVRMGGGGSGTTFNNCTISGCNNGIRGGSGVVTITNCAIFNNVDDIDVSGCSSATVTYMASDDGDGTNAVDISPGATESTEWAKAFTDYANGDFSVKDASSVLYNAGTTIASVTTDIIGTARPQSTAYDIGAFEFPVAVAAGAIINQFQKANLGADLFNGSLI